MMLRAVLSAIFALVAVITSQAAAKLSVTSDSVRSRRLGEPTLFTVAGEGEATVWADNCGTNVVLAKRTVKLESGHEQVLAVTLREPGFLCLHVQTKGATATETVPYEPERIVAAVPEPTDFDAYWQGELARLDLEAPFAVVMEKVPGHYGPDSGFDEYRLQFPTFDGRKVYGFMARPKNLTGKLPLKITIPGAGAGAAWAWDAQPNEITVCLNVIDYEPVEDAAELQRRYQAMNDRAKAEFGAGSYSQVGWGKSREAVWYHDKWLGIVRAIRWLASEPYVDRGAISYVGGSQGGGSGMAVVALCPGVFHRAVFFITAMSDFYGKDVGRASGWPHPIELFRPGTPERQVAKQVAPYFDAVNFARRIHCETMVFLGLEDVICPPPNVMSSYNSLATDRKRIVFQPDTGHGITPEHFRKVHQWLPGGDAW